MMIFWVNFDFESIYLLNYWGYKLQIFPQTSPHIYQNYGKVRFDNYPLVFCLSWNFWRNCFFLSLPFGFCYFSSNHHKNCKFGRNLIFFAEILSIFSEEFDGVFIIDLSLLTKMLFKPKVEKSEVFGPRKTPITLKRFL